MNCETAQSQLSLLLYGELGFDDEERIEQHLEGCPDCRAAKERVKALHTALDGARLEPPPALLADSRREFSARLQSSHSRRRPTGWLSRAGDWLQAPAPWWRLATAAGLLAAGFLGARLTMPPTPAPAPPADPVASRVRFLEPSRDGGVRIVLEETRQRVLSGPLEEEPILRLLLGAARETSDPGLRADSIDLLKQKSEAAPVRRALLHTLEHDPNPAVRLKALEGLKPYAHESDIRQALSRTLLEDESASIRSAAIDLLIESRGVELIGTLQELLRREENDYVRSRSQKALREMNASVGTF